MDEPIRILNIVPNMRSAGIENFIMNVYRNVDRSKVQFDFIVHNQEKKIFDDEIEKLGGKIYRFTYKDDKNLIKYIKDLNVFFKQHKEYKIVHGHMQSMMPLYLYIAKKNKIPVRIAHSHNGDYEKTLKGFVLHIFSRFTKYQSSVNWACSEVAGKYLFGKKRFEVIPNAIDIERFEYNEIIRKEVRQELNLENKFVIGHIGRFELQKNHNFLIDVFNEVQKEKKDTVLILIGEGSMEQKIEEKVEKLKINDKVMFLGLRKDINRLYQAMDCFVLPSLYEGLPVVGIEAQYADLPCVFSSNITKEVKILDNASFEDIERLEEWKNKILQMIINQDVCRKKVQNTKFDIKKISNEMCEKYYEYWKK